MKIRELGRNDLALYYIHNIVESNKLKTETMVVDMLWRAMTNRNYRIVVVTPYENQIRLIFMRINEILRTSPLVSNEIESNTKNPFIIKFKNQSAIVGFTAGNDAASVRGQKADFLSVFFYQIINNNIQSQQ